MLSEPGGCIQTRSTTARDSTPSDQLRTSSYTDIQTSPIAMAKNQPAGMAAATVDYAAIVAAWSPEERVAREKKFLRKIDFRLLPILVRLRSLRASLISTN